MYAVRNKIKDWGLHLRTRSGVGAGRDGHGRQHPPYLQAVRNTEDQDRSPDSGESQTAKIVFLGIEEITESTSVREAIKVEEKDEWSDRTKGDRLMTAMTPKQVEDALMTMSRKYAELSKTYGNMSKLVDLTTGIAMTKSQSQISEYTVITILAAFAEAKTVIRPELTENYDDMILWTLAMQGYHNEKEDRGLPRVERTLTEALAAVDAGMKEQVK